MSNLQVDNIKTLNGLNARDTLTLLKCAPRCWGVINTESPAALLAGYGIASVTTLAAGRSTVVMTTPLTSTVYAVVLSSSITAGRPSGYITYVSDGASARTTTSFAVETISTAASLQISPAVSFAVYQ